MFSLIYGDNYNAVSSEAYKIIRPFIDKDRAVLGLVTGSSPIGLYKKMIADHNANGTSYRHVVAFGLDEYIGLPRDHDQSYWTFMHENLFDGLDILPANIHLPHGDVDDLETECARYESILRENVIDIQVLGIGSDGHIGFNEPGTSFDSVTHVASLEDSTRRDNARFFGEMVSRVPKKAITMGLKSIMRAEHILVIAYGEKKAEAVRGMMQGDICEQCPASILQKHPNVTVVLDRAAASRL